MLEKLLVTGAVVLVSAPLWARPKTDLVVLDNGDRLHCEIKKLERGKLTAKTDAFSTINVKWSRVVAITSEYRFQVELQSGIRYIGTVETTDELGVIAIVNDAGKSRLEVRRIVELIPVESSFFSRIKGSVDAGYDFTQASSATTWSSSAELNYRTPRVDIGLDFSSNVKEQEGATAVNRQNVSGQIMRFYSNRWFAAVIGQGEKSANQGLDFRGLVGGGVGRRVLQSNRTTISLIGGAAFSREKYEDRESYDSNGELVAGFVFDSFKFDSPEIDLSAHAVFLPNLVTAGRYRIQVNGKARIELLHNLYWSLTVYESFDSDPPSATSRRNDFGVTTSLGWSFK